MGVLVESHGNDLRRRTAGRCQRVDDFVSPAIARFSGARHVLLQKPTETALHETLSAGSPPMAWKKATLTSC